MCFYHQYIVVVISGILPVKLACDRNISMYVCEQADSVHYDYYIISIFHGVIGYCQCSVYILVFPFYINISGIIMKCFRFWYWDKELLVTVSPSIVK